MQVVDVADEIAYDNHDLDDGITSGLVEEAKLDEVPIWREINENIRKRYPSIKEEIRKYQAIRALINLQVTDLVKESDENLVQFKIKSPSEATALPHKVIVFSKEMNDNRKPLRKFLQDHLYQHYRVVRMASKACRFIRTLFGIYLDNPEQLPPATQDRLANEDKYRVICDYIAGMTDRYALDEYKKFFEPYEKV